MRWEGDETKAEHGLTVVTLWAMPALGMDCIVLALPPEASLDASIAALQAHAEVAWAQPMNEFHAQGHVDPLYSLQPVAAQWHLDELHAVATGRRVHVAIIDSGVDDTHPDLAQAVQARANFVDVDVPGDVDSAVWAGKGSVLYSVSHQLMED